MPKNPSNHLQNETSPYLQQHAHNPVNWYPWNQTALDKAKKENKPILLSIGYSACHWCHVMERECFENLEIAKIQNEHFVNIKVDREERPDLDEIYMNAVQALTGRGGWPLNVFLTPDLKPFYGGTYFPPQPKSNIPSWPDILKGIADYFRNKKDDLFKTQNQVFDYLENLSKIPGESAQELSGTAIKQLSTQLSTSFDSHYGGFGTAPKFPRSLSIQMLLRQDFKENNENKRYQAQHSLNRMAQGGLYDQIGGGFHRYSTDEKWLIPHYEKMLYDNALLLKAYTEAFVHSKNTYYRDIAHEICEYINREMTAHCGAFYSTQDADSEGEEGRYFVWTPQQIEDAIGKKWAPFVCTYFDISSVGNFENGASTPWINHDLDKVCHSFKLSVSEGIEILEQSRKKLLRARQKRTAPDTDKKILAGWNGLMIGALAKTGFHLDCDDYIQRAIKAKDFILKHMLKDQLYRVHSAGQEDEMGKASIPAFLEDYAYLTEALIDLFEVTGSVQILKEALSLQKQTEEFFDDEDTVGFYFTKPQQEDIVTRSRSGHDSATPSAQSVAIHNVMRLGYILGETDHLDRCEHFFKAYQDAIEKTPRAYVKLIMALDFRLQNPPQIILAGNPESPLYQEFKNHLRKYYLPYKNLIFLDQNKDSWRDFPVFLDKLTHQDAKLYICQNHSCEKPIETIEELKHRFQN